MRLENFQQFQAINVLSDPGHIPGPIQIPQAMHVVLVWELDDGKTAHNILSARYPGVYPGTVAMANTLLAAFGAALTSSTLEIFLNPATNLHLVMLRDLGVLNAAFVESASTAHRGTAAGIALPDENAVTVTLRTARAGPGHRGRFYIPGLNSAAVGGSNTIDPGCVTAASAFGEAVRSAINAQGIFQVLALPHRIGYTGSTGRVHPERLATTEDVTLAECRDNHWDTQRRRGLR